MKDGHPYAKGAKVSRRTRKHRNDCSDLFREFRVIFASFAFSPERASP
jgi:hypothetical protein